MHVQIGAVRMFNQTPQEYILTLLRRYHGLRMNAETEGIEIINAVADTFDHRLQEGIQGLCL